ncbi:hypothetical protein SCHPADRAFT_935183 [Schizopora paradoxa]|uniref:Uncharacterized protein n=1 Tax=Schizopora paradoxa TaxID=27342 RepID=A0A0H2S6U6_9AGAM|nr:hypothetical protein SCHPADRAFT_935183 [Schizopora paradoxa]
MKIFSTEGINVESTLLSKRGEQGVTKISILVHDGASASAGAFATVIEGGDQFGTETAFTSSNTNPTTTVSVGHTSTSGPTNASITNPSFGTSASTTSTSVLSSVTNFTSNTISSTTSNLGSISSTSIGGQSVSTDSTRHTRSTSSGATITVSISGGTVTQTATSSASTSRSNTAATAVLFTFLGLISVAISVIWFVKAARRRTTNHGGDCQESATVHSARSHSGHSRIITPFPSNASEVNASRIQETKVRLSDIPSSIDGSLHSVPCYSESSPPAYTPTSEDPEVYQQV